MAGSKERLIAFVLLQKGEDQMMSKALWTGKEHPDWNCGLVRKSSTREKNSKWPALHTIDKLKVP